MTQKKQNTNDHPGHPLNPTPVAIIGMASLFPGARNLQQYWDNILQKVNAITEVPPSRWHIDDYYHPDVKSPDKTYCKMGGFIPDVEFDPTEFGLPPNILEATDVSQLLALTIARDALEDAGYGDKVQFDRQRAGVILGVVGISMKLFSPMISRLQYPVWDKVLTNCGLNETDRQKVIEKMKLAYSSWEENTFPGMIGNVIAGRIANRFDLGGTNCTVDAACGSSLAAVKMATNELALHKSDLMISGGVDLDNSIGTFLCFSKTPAFSKTGHSRPFDAGADGMLAGEGIGMLVLKRLKDAEQDGDRIYAVIKGIGSSSDGRFKSIYAPRAEGQANAIRRAYQEAGFEMNSIQLLEAHGTGTMAGDPEEVKGIKLALGEDGADHTSIALGSVKSQIGHTKATAGTASLIKTTLALYHKILPPTINVEKPGAKLEIENSPLYINSETRPWIRQGKEPRRAGVSAFGFGGTNFHIALEECQAQSQQAHRLNSASKMLILSSSSPTKLAASCRETLKKISSNEGEVFLNEWSRQSDLEEIPQTSARLGFVADSSEETIDMLQTAIRLLEEKPDAEDWEHPRGIFYRKSGLETNGKIAAIFSGQGSQYLEMGRELALNFPLVRDTYFEIDRCMCERGETPVSKIVFPPPVFDDSEREQQKHNLQLTENAQPAIGAFSSSLYKIFEQAGFKADFTAGHSFGELGALWAAGVLNDEDYYHLIIERGKAMAAPDDAGFDAGTMVAIKGDIQNLRKLLKDNPGVTLANWNSNEQVVLAGDRAGIESFSQTLKEKGYSVIPLQVSAAFHTPLVAHAQQPFADALKSVKFKSPGIPVYSNTTGKAHSGGANGIRKNMIDHILNPVLFKDEIENMYKAGARIFIEFGPKNVATNLIHNILENQPHHAIALNANGKKNSDRQMREAYIRLKVIGLLLKDLDPYYQIMPVASRKKKMSIILNGGLYLSEKTRNAFQKALEEPVNLQLKPESTGQSEQVQGILEQSQNHAIEESIIETKPISAPVDQSTVIEGANGNLQKVGSDVLRSHEQFMANQMEYARTFSQLIQSQTSLIKDISIYPEKLEKLSPILEKLGNNIERFNELQASSVQAHLSLLDQGHKVIVPSPISIESLKDKPDDSDRIRPPTRELHNTPTHHQESAAGRETAATNQLEPAGGNGHHRSQPLEKQTYSQTQPVLDLQNILRDITAIVSEKTGYPIEMLEPDMDMESDLGIDSIKRVEIIGAIRESYPDLPKIEPEQFSEMKTLEHISSFIKKDMTSSQEMSETIETKSLVHESSSNTPEKNNLAQGQQSISTTVMDIVSQKTGYPAEMLELEMDMEADLGIDSIKRVEIIGTLREQFPHLPKLETEQFSEITTLGHIVAFLSKNQSRETISNEENTTQKVENDLPAHPAGTPADSPSPEDTHKILIDIVSQKTGYPAEMLEPDMDMESDLGIDSIKRVEIIGALREKYPDLPKIETEQFNELNTLQRIVDFINDSSQQPAKKTDSSAPPELDDIATFTPTQVSISALPAPDRLETSFPAHSTCLITDDGTGITSHLVRALSDTYEKVVVMSLPKQIVERQSPLPSDIIRYELHSLDQSELEEALTDITTKHGNIGAFFHLNPRQQRAAASSIQFSEKQKQIVKWVFLMAKHLKTSLVDMGSQNNRSIFLTVTHLDGMFGLANDTDFDPVEGGLFGLVKTINLEWDTVFCRAIDFAPDMEEDDSVNRIMAEIHDPNLYIKEVGYTHSGRWTMSIEAEPEMKAVA